MHPPVAVIGRLSDLHPLAFRPPLNIRLALGQEEALKTECQRLLSNDDKSGNVSFIWSPAIQACDYTLATKIVEYLALNDATTTHIWLPRLSDDSANKK
jgi:hypothetical protein